VEENSIQENFCLACTRKSGARNVFLGRGNGLGSGGLGSGGKEDGADKNQVYKEVRIHTGGKGCIACVHLVPNDVR